MVDVLIRPRFEQQVAETAVRAAAQAALYHQDVTSGASLSIVIVDDDEIRALNRQYRGIDAPTDVLSFGTQDDGSPDQGDAASTFVIAPEQQEEAGAYLGDVVVAYPQVVAQAAQQGHSREREMSLLVVHGVLHLLGYDHATPHDKAQMWAVQDRVLESLRQVDDAPTLT